MTTDAELCLLEMSKESYDIVKSDDELASAIGHELGRVLAGHNREEAGEKAPVALGILSWLPLTVPGIISATLGYGTSSASLLYYGGILGALPTLPFIILYAISGRARLITSACY